MVQTEIFSRRFQIFVPKTFRQSSSGVEMEKFVFWESRLGHTLLSLPRDVHVNISNPNLLKQGGFAFLEKTPSVSS